MHYPAAVLDQARASATATLSQTLSNTWVDMTRDDLSDVDLWALVQLEALVNDSDEAVPQ